jgi:hypothetical protein
MGILQIAVDIDWFVAERTGKAPLIASTFQESVPLASQVISDQLGKTPTLASKAPTTKSHRVILEYLAAVKARDVQYEKSRTTKPKRQRRTSVKRTKGAERKR